MKNKMGRPIAGIEPAGIVFAARFTEEEAEALNNAIKQSGQSKSDWIRNGLLLHAITNKPPSYKRFPVNCANPFQYRGKSALIGVQVGERLVGYKGDFIVRQGAPAGPFYVSLACRGLLFRDDPPNTGGRTFHLSQAHVDSIIPLSSAEADFEVQRPFLSRNRMRF